MMDLTALARDVRAAVRLQGLPPLPFSAREEAHRVELLFPPVWRHQRVHVEEGLARVAGRRVDLTLVQTLGPWGPDPTPARAAAVRRCVLTGEVVLASFDPEGTHGETWSYVFQAARPISWGAPPGRARKDADCAAVERGWVVDEALTYPTTRPLERDGYTFFPSETA